ncbi:hypothetical protein K3495_g6201 [Podosphaera aphanis]|nr:hypothetical protein K3495_g6201 [Podosphaera aphanis]
MPSQNLTAGRHYQNWRRHPLAQNRPITDHSRSSTNDPEPNQNRLEQRFSLDRRQEAKKVSPRYQPRNFRNSGHHGRDSRLKPQQVFNTEVNRELDEEENHGRDEPADKCAYDDAYLQGMENKTEDEESEIEANEIEVVEHYLVVPRKRDIQPNFVRPRFSSKPQPQNKVPPEWQKQPSPKLSHSCQILKETFISNNHLHVHLKNAHPNHRAILRKREQD